MNAAEQGGVSSSVVTSVVTGFVAVMPSEVFGYLEKLLSVFVLAMVAEAGRRLLSKLWRKP